MSYCGWEDVGSPRLKFEIPVAGKVGYIVQGMKIEPELLCHSLDERIELIQLKKEEVFEE